MAVVLELKLRPERPKPSSRLTELREASRLTKRSLAGLIGVHGSAISDWESGKLSIPDEHKTHLADLFGVSVAFLMGWDENQHHAGTVVLWPSERPPVIA